MLIRGLVLDMKTFDNGTSCESYSNNMQKFEFRSLQSLSWAHILLSLIWWLYGWVSGTLSSFRNSKGGFETLAFSNMHDLRLLRLNYVQLNGSYKNIPAGLRWLCMHGFPLSCIPSDLQMEDMVALDMSNSKLQRLWKKPTLLRSLKFLNLSSCCELVSLGHFSGLPLLERMMLVGCTSLVEVCESLGNYCDKLEVLDMSNCNKLRELPASIGKLKNLRNLSIDGCSNLGGVPCQIKDMESLEVLEANNINIESHVYSSAIVEAPPRSIKPILISFPCSLVSLSLKNNKLSNESFPQDFSSLSMLKNLNLEGNQIDSLPDCVRSLSRLDDLRLGYCKSLKTVLFAPNTIKCLVTSGCSSLERITFHPEKSAPPDICYYEANSLTEVQDKFILQVLAEIDEDIIHSLGWLNIEFLKYYKVSVADCARCYPHARKILPAKMLYEHGIFSAYLKGHEVPKWFTHRSKGSSFTLKSSVKNGKIRGLNVCVVNIISRTTEVGPSRIEIRNLTKNRTWTYQPITYVIPENDELEDGDEVVVWLSHWMFGNNEFEDGDEVSVHYSVKIIGYHGSGLRYDDEGPDYAHVREYGISLVYDDDGSQKEDPLAYYKSWSHIIGGDLSAAEVSSSHYLLKPRQHD